MVVVMLFSGRQRWYSAYWLLTLAYFRAVCSHVATAMRISRIAFA